MCEIQINNLLFLYTQVRPLLPKEKIAGEEMCVRIIPATNQLVLGKDRAFTFDHVLSSKTTQVNIIITFDHVLSSKTTQVNVIISALENKLIHKTRSIACHHCGCQFESNTWQVRTTRN